MRGTRVIAHRTCPLQAPENSREGTGLAAVLGADAVEIDVRLSRDGETVLSHDPTLLRVTGKPIVVRWSAASRICSTRIRNSKETVPSLTDLLDVLPENMDVAVDVKDGAAMSAAVEVLRKNRRLSSALLWSSDSTAIKVARTEAPNCEVAYLLNTETESAAREYLHKADELGATAVSVMDVALTPGVVKLGHDLGLTVNAWVRSLDLQPAVLACRPDAVVTDWPAEAIRHQAARTP